MRWHRALTRFAAARHGTVSLITAFALPALIGTLALATEVSYWLVESRSLQNAADSAAMAASIDGTSAYLAQAKAVTARYGFVDGVDGVTVTGSNAATCATGGTDCYSITVATTLPVYLGAVVGYIGNTTVGGVKSTRLSAVAVAKRGGVAHDYCLVGLAGNGVSPAISSNNSTRADLANCGVVSNTAAQCSGYNLGADFGDAVGTNTGCGVVPSSNNKAFADPYAALAAQLPGDYCGGNYPQVGSLPSGNRWSGTVSLGSVTLICGDLQLIGNVTVIAPQDAVMLLYNGELATNGFRLQTASGSALALVFTGTNNSNYQHAPTGTGSLDITAPTTGPAAGVAIYQDPALTIGVQVANPASQPAWALTGLIYLPRADLVMRGAVSKSSFGKRCTVLVANSVNVNATALVLSTVECGAAGLNVVPTSVAAGRGNLVG